MASTGVTPDVADIYQAWADDRDFDLEVADALRRRGIVPKVTWEPWVAVPSGQPVGDQSAYALRTIVAGAHDGYLQRWAKQVAAHDGPVIIRLMHEMNGDWYPWSEQVNGNRPGEYVAAWHHVRGVFEVAGADQVIWEWAPNQEYPGSAPLEPLYPGDAYVDRIGLSAYNWGTLPDDPQQPYRWRDFAELVDPTLEAIAAFTARPLGVAETGSSSSGGDRAAWITEMFDHALARQLAFVNYFAMDTQRPWRFTTDPVAVEAFAEGFARTRAGP